MAWENKPPEWVAKPGVATNLRANTSGVDNPVSVADALRAELEPQPEKVTWKQVIAVLDADYEARKADREEAARKAAEVKPDSVVSALRIELEKVNGHQGDTPALNSAKLLELAAGTDVPHSTREQIAAALRDHWTRQERQSEQ